MLVLYCPYCDNVLDINYDLSLSGDFLIDAYCSDCGYGVTAYSVSNLISILNDDYEFVSNGFKELPF